MFTRSLPLRNLGKEESMLRLSPCKGPETGGSLGCSRHRKLTVAGGSKVKWRLVGDEVGEEVRSPGRGSPVEIICLLEIGQGLRVELHSFVRSLQRPRDESFAGCRMLMTMVKVNTHGPSPTFSALGVLINWPFSHFSTREDILFRKKLKWPAHLITEYWKGHRSTAKSSNLQITDSVCSDNSFSWQIKEQGLSCTAD